MWDKKTRSSGQIIDSLCTLSSGYIFDWNILNIGQKVCCDDFHASTILGYMVRSKETRSSSQIIEHPHVHSKSYIFNLNIGHNY